MKITIPKPCHENWEAMTPAEKGRFCSVCSKTVRDFTVASDEEIISAFTNSTEEICGTFQESQLNRNLQYSYINSIFVKFAVGFILTTGGLVSVNAQQKNDTVKVEEIDEVVMTGLIKKKNENITGGAYTVVSKEELNKPQEVVVKNIKGKIDGGGENPISRNNINSPAKIRIGGANTSLKSDDKPIVVLDEKVISLKEFGEVNPQSIETVNILKGNSAMALYGSDGKNGVILVTTKKKK